jgi:hypothetical protein
LPAQFVNPCVGALLTAAGVVAFVAPHLLPLENELLRKNEFKVTYHPFDWRLNDLTGGRPQ